MTLCLPTSLLRVLIDLHEPEAHLDDLVENIIALPGLNYDVKIGGISFKDDTTLQF